MKCHVIVEMTIDLEEYGYEPGTLNDAFDVARDALNTHAPWPTTVTVTAWDRRGSVIMAPSRVFVDTQRTGYEERS